jgi:hypothetical protein
VPFVPRAWNTEPSSVETIFAPSSNGSQMYLSQSDTQHTYIYIS